MNIPKCLPKQDDIVNSLNYEGIAIWVAVLPLSWQWQTACWLLPQTKEFEWLAVMKISQPPGIILHIIIAYQRCLNCSWMLPETLCSTCNYNIRVTHRNGAIKHIFYTNQIHGGIISRLFFIHFVAHALALHLAVKILLKSFCMKISTLALHISVGCISSQNARPHFVTQPILLSETF